MPLAHSNRQLADAGGRSVCRIVFRCLFVSLIVIRAGDLVAADKCSWENCPKWSPNGINVHLICHTHDDLGWIKSVDDYYTGRHQNLVPVAVENILNTVVDELSKAPGRRFSYAETGFLHRWLITQPPERLSMLKRLVSETGQLEFVNGGWTQPDEATTHYYELLNTYQLGLGVLNATFGRCGHPRVGWQLDPFGHSREHANLLSLMEYEVLYMTRIHWRELEARGRDKSLQFVWRTSNDLNTSILTGVDHRGTYAQPYEFCWDALCNSEPIVDDHRFSNYNLDERLKSFAKLIHEQAAKLLTNQLFVYVGGDFQYSNAIEWFTNIDRLIRGFTERKNVYNISMFYSTPACYTEALRASMSAVDSSRQWAFPERTNDFFPYATNRSADASDPIEGTGYWTGYFTSKPTLKGLIRESNALLQLAHQMTTGLLLGAEQSSSVADELIVLERALALSTHHDGVTYNFFEFDKYFVLFSGTSKQSVTEDYARRLLQGWGAAEKVLNDVWASNNGANDVLPTLQFCRLANESVCSASVWPPADGSGRTLVVIFNGNAHVRYKQLVRLPFPYDGKTHEVHVVDESSQQTVTSEIVETFLGAKQQQLNQTGDALLYELQFLASVSPVGFAQYSVSVTFHGGGGHGRAMRSIFDHAKKPLRKRIHHKHHQHYHHRHHHSSSHHTHHHHHHHHLHHDRRHKNSVDNMTTTGVSDGAFAAAVHYKPIMPNTSSGTQTIQNNRIQLTFDTHTGLLTGYKCLLTGRVYTLSQHFVDYIGATNVNSNGNKSQATGAYIFRPNASEPSQSFRQAKLEFLKTGLVEEARQIFAGGIASQVIRLAANTSYVEFDWIVGPLPDNSTGGSHELVTRYAVQSAGFDARRNEKTSGIFYTDANGRQMIERRRNDPTFWGEAEEAEPMPGNFYPVATRIALRLADDAQTQMSVLTDRAQAGGSLRDGEIELLLHRRAFWDDGWGVDEPLDEPGQRGQRALVVRGRHWLLLEPRHYSRHRQLALEMLHRPFIGLSFRPSTHPAAGGKKSPVPGDAGDIAKSANFTLLATELPENVNLLTLRPLSGGKNPEKLVLLLRLEHIFQQQEDRILSRPVEVDLATLFLDFEVLESEQMKLAGNGLASATRDFLPLVNGTIVVLKPQQISTLRLVVRRRRRRNGIARENRTTNETG